MRGQVRDREERLASAQALEKLAVAATPPQGDVDVSEHRGPVDGCGEGKLFESESRVHCAARPRGVRQGRGAGRADVPPFRPVGLAPHKVQSVSNPVVKSVSKVYQLTKKSPEAMLRERVTRPRGQDREI